jgi:hypothetical protein
MRAYEVAVVVGQARLNEPLRFLYVCGRSDLAGTSPARPLLYLDLILPGIRWSQVSCYRAANDSNSSPKHLEAASTDAGSKSDDLKTDSLLVVAYAWTPTTPRKYTVIPCTR